VLARLLIPVAVVELPLLFDLLMIVLLVIVDLAITLDDITAAIATTATVVNIFMMIPLYSLSNDDAFFLKRGSMIQMLVR
jgi:hypothetical protein